MIHSIKSWKYKGNTIYLMHDSGANWYEVEGANGEFKGNFDSLEEAQEEIRSDGMCL